MNACLHLQLFVCCACYMHCVVALSCIDDAAMQWSTIGCPVAWAQKNLKKWVLMPDLRTYELLSELKTYIYIPSAYSFWRRSVRSWRILKIVLVGRRPSCPVATLVTVFSAIFSSTTITRIRLCRLGCATPTNLQIVIIYGSAKTLRAKSRCNDLEIRNLLRTAL